MIEILKIKYAKMLAERYNHPLAESEMLEVINDYLPTAYKYDFETIFDIFCIVLKHDTVILEGK